MNCLRITAVVNEGRWANRILHYVAGRAIAETVGCAYRVSPWFGDMAFNLSDEKWRFSFRTSAPIEEFYHTNIAKWGDVDEVVLPPFFALPAELQGVLTSRFWLKRYLSWLPGWDGDCLPREKAVLHIRRGDFDRAGMPHYTTTSLIKATGRKRNELLVVEEGETTDASLFPWPISHILQDFHLIRLAEACYPYPNSTFGLVAGLMGDGVVHHLVHSGEEVIYVKRDDEMTSQDQKKALKDLLVSIVR